MSEWKKQLSNIYTTLSENETLHDMLTSIDRKIIRRDSIEHIIYYAHSRLCKLVEAKKITFHVGNTKIFDCQPDINDEDLVSYVVSVDEEENWETYIDTVTVSLKKDNSMYRKGMPLALQSSMHEHSVESVSRQLNIAIRNDVSRNTNNLYKKIVQEFSTFGDKNIIFDSICRNIINIFPSLQGLGDFSKDLLDDKIHIQLILQPYKEKNWLKIVGSTDAKKSYGGYITTDNSICGAILKYTNVEDNLLPSGFKKAIYKDNSYTYFNGSPDKSNYYRKTTILTSKSELSIPLYLKNGDFIGLINLESLEKNRFTDAHAKSLIYNSTGMAELANNIDQIAAGRNHNIKAFTTNIQIYIESALSEYKHSVGHTLQYLSKMSFDVEEEQFSKEDMLQFLDKLHDGINTNKAMIVNSLMSIVDIGKSIMINDNIDIAKSYIKADLDQHNINFIVKQSSEVKEVALDNLFPLYLKSLFHNSISSIIDKKTRLTANNLEDELEEYKPYIVVKIYDPQEFNEMYKEDDFPHNSMKNNKKCRIVIEDNGDGIEAEFMHMLGRYKKSHKNRSGTGLYSFKQYLLLHQGRILDFDSELYKYFKIDFVIDIA